MRVAFFAFMVDMVCISPVVVFAIFDIESSA